MNQGADRRAPAAASTSGAVVRGVAITVALLAALGGGIWWWTSQRSAVVEPAAQQQVVAAPSPTAVLEDPYERARTQIAADRVAQPAGDNAIETYLALLVQTPDDNSARQALTELLPFASRLAERAAVAGDVAEVNRLIALIERADPGYAQLGMLRERVAAIEQRVVDQQQRDQQRADQLAAAQQAAAQPVATAPLPTPVTSSSQAAVPTRPPVTGSSSSAASSAPVIRTPPVSSSAAAVVAPPAAARAEPVIVEAEQINTIAPQYPPQALARRQEGWVDLEMLIDVRGMPRDVQVVGAQPAGVFNREALRAAARWRFKPRTIDGSPVDSRLKRRMNFRLPR